MRQQWRVHRRKEVTAYLVSLREHGSEIRQAIESLKAGTPSDATEVEPDTYLWFEAQHWIGFVVDTTEKAIYVSLVELAEEPPQEE